MRNIKATIEYDGTNYHGFQTQLNKKLPTIQGKLESCLMRALMEPIKITGAGRTDAGVHAEGQVINFKINNNIPLERLPMVINGQLPNDIAIKVLEEVRPDFHAQYDARGKYYIYRIYNNRIPSAFHSRFSYYIPYKLDMEKIREGSRLFVGTHNFKGFSASGTNVKNFVRTIHSLDIVSNENIWEFHIQGNGFLYKMVRVIIGTLVELGKGRRDEDSIKEALNNKDRTFAGKTAPPQGLCLKKVFYS
ncbi:MAG: hypothetical protein VR72_04255 [Clostridiaceae bacterium BRH_c20a]|nr:MAG: hypothetical protein VR72_04255 [Clostridiaceae bacterium BRH_c20a]